MANNTKQSAAEFFRKYSDIVVEAETKEVIKESAEHTYYLKAVCLLTVKSDKPISNKELKQFASVNFSLIPEINVTGQSIETLKVVKQLSTDINEANAPAKQMDVNQLATISDEALDNAYHYGRSSPGNTFGWCANVESAKAAQKLIAAGVTDIEKISDAIHNGWNITAKRFVQNPQQFDDTAKLEAAGKLEAKLQQRQKLMTQNYAQLPEDEKEKDRVVARALLQALTGQQVSEDQTDMFVGSTDNSIPDFDEKVKKINQMTSENMHSEAVLAGARLFGLNKLATAAENVCREHMRRRSMSQELLARRSEILDKIMAVAKERLSPEDFTKFFKAY